MKDLEYTILKHESLVDMVKHVNALLRDGWAPVGGVAVGTEYERGGDADGGALNYYRVHFYAQAMVRPRDGALA